MLFKFLKGGIGMGNVAGAEEILDGITEKEKNLINLIRKLGYGEIKVIIQDSCPIRVEELRKSIKL